MPRCDNSVRVHFIIPSSALRSFLSLKWDGSTVIQAWSSGIHLTITSLFPLYFFFSHNVDIVIGNPTCWGGTSVVLNTHANRTAALQLNCVCQQIWLEHQQDYIWRWKVESGFSRWKMSSYLLFSSFTLHLDLAGYFLTRFRLHEETLSTDLYTHNPLLYITVKIRDTFAHASLWCIEKDRILIFSSEVLDNRLHQGSLVR